MNFKTYIHNEMILDMLDQQRTSLSNEQIENTMCKRKNLFPTPGAPKILSLYSDIAPILINNMLSDILNLHN